MVSTIVNNLKFSNISLLIGRIIISLYSRVNMYD